MKILLGFIILLCTLISSNYYYPKVMQHEPDGFRGIAWHSAVSEVSSSSDEDRVLIINDKFGRFSSCEVYERKNEWLRFGGADVDSVLYSFEDDLGFVSATICFTESEKSENFEVISEYCQKIWGRPALKKIEDEESGELDYTELYWRGKRADVTLWYSGKSNLGALHIYAKKSSTMAKNDFNQLLQEDESLLGLSLD